jgi:hypothetical protein
MESDDGSLAKEFVGTLQSVGEEMAANADDPAQQELKIHRKFEHHKAHLAELSACDRHLQD